MREIKFRYYYMKKMYFVSVEKETMNSLDQLMNVCPIMQYIGLKNKKGVEIYEGDILQDGEGRIGVCTYGIHTIPVAEYDGSNTIGFYVNRGPGYDLSICDNGNNREIIGDIYSNPNFLTLIYNS